MGKNGYLAVEATGIVVTLLSVQAGLRSLSGHASELLWGMFAWVPGGSTGQLILFGSIALIAAVAGGWAHRRQGRTPAQAYTPA